MKSRQQKHRIPHSTASIEAFLLFVYAGLFFFLIYTQDIYRYVHERHIPLLIITAACFIAIGCITLIRVYRQRRKQKRDARQFGKKLHLAVFLMPLCALPFLYTDYHLPLLAYAGAVTGRSAPVVQSSETKLMPEDGIITMHTENFAAWLTELYTNAETWEGTPIQVSGFVWKDSEQFASDECAVVRMMMICCAADMQPVGIRVRWDQMESVSEGDWVTVSGVLTKVPYKTVYNPLIIIEHLEKTPRPVREYVYP